MTMDLGRYGLREILDTTIFDFTTNKPFMFMDYALVATNDWKANTTYATGGSGAVRRIAFNDSKTSTLSIETEIFTLKHLAMLAGTDIVSSLQDIYKHEILVASTPVSTKTSITLAKTPIDLASITAYTYVNGVASEIPVAVSTLVGNVVSFAAADVPYLAEVEVFYQWSTVSVAKKVSFTAKDFPKYMKIVGDSLFADEVGGEMIPSQMIYYKVKLMPNFTLNLSPTGAATKIKLDFDIFPVKINGADTLADMILYED